MMNIFPKTLLEKRYQNYWRLVSIFNEIDIEKKNKNWFLVQKSISFYDVTLEVIKYIKYLYKLYH